MNKNPLLTYRNKKNVLKIMYMLVVFFAIINFSACHITNDTDPSWIYFLNSTFCDGKFVFGKDIVFTYGPLGFLLYPQNFGHSIAWATFFWLIIGCIAMYFMYQILFANEFARFNLNLSNILCSFLLFLMSFILLPNLFEIILNHVVLLILFSCLVRDDKFEWFLLAVLIVIFCFLLKFNIFVMLLGNLIVFCIVRKIIIGHGTNKYFLILCFIPLAIIGEYLIYNPCLNEFFNYIIGAKNIVDGYIEAMSLPVIDQYLFPCLIILFSAMVMIYKVFDKWNIVSLCLLLPSLFMVYRHSTVRGDHISGFFGMFVIIFSLYVLFINDNLNRKSEIYAFTRKLVVIFLVSLILGFYYGGVGSVKPINFYDKYFTEKIDQRQYFIPFEFIKMIGKDTFSVYPTEIAMVKDFTKFIPLYSVQAYSQYTHYLDKKQADIFASKNAPKYVVFNVDAIDGRYALIENPETWKELAIGYDIVAIAQKNNYNLYNRSQAEFLLCKNKKKRYEYTGKEIIIEPNTLNEYGIPESGGHLFLSVDSQLNFRGYLAKIFYKIPPIYMTVQFNDGQNITGRVIFDNLRNETIIDSIVLNDYDFLSFYQGKLLRKVKNIKFIGDGCKYYDILSVKVRPFRIVG